MVTISNSAGQAIDGNVIAGLRELGGQELLRELLGLFRADTPPRIAALEVAVAAGTVAEIGRVAHSLKSSCANVGALVMSGLCRALEEEARAGSAAHAEERLRALLAEWELVQVRLGELEA
ncbi:MAG: Hpt domain-containing protein [Planctomycetes bacterium]|nr:Hpt domain-containing protein [Planctomycetota bacterium]